MSKKSFLSRALDVLFKSDEPNKHVETQERTKKTTTEHNEPGGESVLDEETIPQQPVVSPHELMKALGVEIYNDAGDDYYLVGFQGGVFVFNFTNDCLTAMYNDVAECTYSESIKAAMIANDINGDYSAWSCYLRTMKDGKAEKPIKVCFSQLFFLRGTVKSVSDFVRSVMINAFTVARDFRTRFQEALSNDKSLSSILNNRDFVNNLELAKRHMEAGDWDDEKDAVFDPIPLKVKSFVEMFSDTEFGAPSSLQIVAGTQLDTVNGGEQVNAFDIRSYILNHPQCNELESVTVTVFFELQNLVIHLKKMPGSTAKSLFFMMSVVRSGVETDMFRTSHTSVSFRTTVEIRLTTQQDDYWEVKFMVQDAQDKYAQHRESELTDEQKMLLIYLHPTIQDDLYWGMKYYNKHCMVQALFFFQRLQYNLLRMAQTYPDEAKLLLDTYLYIGVIYNQMKLYDRAFYYLNKAVEGESVYASESYINCMCGLKDGRVIDFIKDQLRAVSSMLDDDKTFDSYYKYYKFLRRKLVQSLMFEYRMTEAEKYLKQMVEDGDDVDFALSKLENIKERRKNVRMKMDSIRRSIEKKKRENDINPDENEEESESLDEDDVLSGLQEIPSETDGTSDADLNAGEEEKSDLPTDSNDDSATSKGTGEQPHPKE